MSVAQIAEKDQSPRRHKFRGPRVPPNLFGIALGIVGLAQAWHAAVPVLGTVQAVPGALDVLAAALWLVLAGAYLAQGPRIILADLRDPVLSPFVSSSALTAVLLAAALAQDAPAAGRVLVIVFLAVTIAIGGLADRPVDDRWHQPGFLASIGRSASARSSWWTPPCRSTSRQSLPKSAACMGPDTYRHTI